MQKKKKSQAQSHVNNEFPYLFLEIQIKSKYEGTREWR